MKFEKNCFSIEIPSLWFCFFSDDVMINALNNFWKKFCCIFLAFHFYTFLFISKNYFSYLYSFKLQSLHFFQIKNVFNDCFKLELWKKRKIGSHYLNYCEFLKLVFIDGLFIIWLVLSPSSPPDEQIKNQFRFWTHNIFEIVVNCSFQNVIS